MGPNPPASGRHLLDEAVIITIERDRAARSETLDLELFE